MKTDYSNPMLSRRFLSTSISPSTITRIKKAPNRGGQARLLVEAFQIDRRKHLELAFERQEQHEKLLSRAEEDVHARSIVQVANLEHLERLFEAAGGAIVVLFLHASSCGLCKDVLMELEGINKEVNKEGSRIVFLKHDIWSEYDFYSDLARYYNIKSVPKFMFFVDGAMVKTTGLPDSRRILRNRSEIKTTLKSERSRLRTTLRHLLLKNAPSARK